MAESYHCTHEADFGALNTAIAGINETLADLKKILVSHAALEQQCTQLNEMCVNLHTRLHSLELKQATHHGKSIWLEKVMWAIVSMALGAFLVGKATGFV